MSGILEYKDYYNHGLESRITSFCNRSLKVLGKSV